MSATDPIGSAPEANSFSFVRLLTAAIAAPIFWLGQLSLGYTVSAYGCYPGPSPLAAGPRGLFTVLIAFDVIAILAALSGGGFCLFAWSNTRHTAKDNAQIQRTCFLALWGILSSACFFLAILFNTIASVMAPICGE